jgi:hypothetical protein
MIDDAPASVFTCKEVSEACLSVLCGSLGMYWLVSVVFIFGYLPVINMLEAVPVVEAIKSALQCVVHALSCIFLSCCNRSMFSTPPPTILRSLCSRDYFYPGSAHYLSVYQTVSTGCDLPRLSSWVAQQGVTAFL